MTLSASDGPVIETARLRLRPPVLADFDAYADYVADAEGMAFIGGAQSRPVAWRSFMAYAGAWATSGASMFWVFERAPDGGEGAFVGRIGPWRPEGWPGCEVGWGIARRFFGQGYAGEAAVACMDFAFDRLGWTDVIHSIDPANAPSIRLAERLGSRRRADALLPDPINRTVGIWGQTREDWRSRRR